MTAVLKVNYVTVYVILMIALTVGSLFFVFPAGSRIISAGAIL